MKLSFSLAVLAAMIYCTTAESGTSNPMVNFYSQNIGRFDVANTLICHVSRFHPPDITIEVLEDGAVIPGASQKDLAFDATWQFHLTRSAPFTPARGHVFTCRVTHQGKVSNYRWEPDM